MRLDRLTEGKCEGKNAPQRTANSLALSRACVARVLVLQLKIICGIVRSRCSTRSHFLSRTLIVGIEEYFSRILWPLSSLSPRLIQSQNVSWNIFILNYFSIRGLNYLSTRK
jgi:hypothetical protein